MATRRTHIVRCAADPKDPDSLYADVEVLDALAFRGPGDKELVLTFDQKNIEPFIVDEVGGKNAKSPNNGTRRSHMERVKSKDGGLIDVEVLDVVAFRGPGNKEWILNLPSKKGSEYSTNSKSSGTAPFTRRTHTEKISEGFEKKPTAYMTVTRTDEVAFRTIMGEEMIIKMPSSDDPNSSAERADTFIVSPKGYDPTKEDGPKPPLNKDKNVYVSFPEGANLFTGDEKLSQGMLWWIRKISGAELLFVRVEIDRVNEAMDVRLQTNFEFVGDIDDQGRTVKVDQADLDPDIMSPDKVDANHPAQKLDFKTVNMWGSKYVNKPEVDGPNPDGVEGNTELKWTALFWVNVAKVKKELGEVRMQISIPELKAPPSNAPSGSVSFIWAISGDNTFSTVPIHPRPDATNAFGPYPFGDTDAATYIGLWNTGPFNPRTFTVFGIPPPPNPDLGIGWTNPGDAAAMASALNAVGEASLAKAKEIAAANDLHINFATPTVFTSFTIDFPPGGTQNNPACKLTVDAWRFNGKTNFPYDDENTIAFDKPKGDSKSKTKTITSTAPAAMQFVTVVLDKEGLRIE